MFNRPRTVKIVLKDHSAAGTYNPTDGVCETNEEKHRTGCGATLKFYYTHPNRKRMPFDGEPVVVEKFPIGTDACVIASVENTNVHFSTCPHARANDSRRREAAKGAA